MTKVQVTFARKTLRKLKRPIVAGLKLLACLSSTDLMQLGKPVVAVVKAGIDKVITEHNLAPDVVAKLHAAIDGTDAIAALEAVLQEANALGAAEMKKKRDAKPRNRERDREIVRMKDEVGTDFKKIGRELMFINKGWCDDHGKPLKPVALRKAYRREKDRQKDAAAEVAKNASNGP